MALNEPNKPDDVKTVTGSASPGDNKAAPIGGKEIKPGSDDTVIQPRNDNSIPQKQDVVQDAKSKHSQDEKKPEVVKEAVSTDKKPPQADKSVKAEKPGKEPKAKAPAKDKPTKTAGIGGVGGGASGKSASPKEQTPPVPEKPPEPTKAPRNANGAEKIVFINLSEIKPFKDHPFQVRDDEEMRAMVSSVKDKGVTQPAIVRPREDGGYEMVSGHRRQKASELAGFIEIPCIVRNMTDEQAITQMVEDNTNQRESILPSERAKALKMQLDAIKKQGSRGDINAENGNGNGERSNAIVAERNKMAIKQVQRYIKLNDLVPELMKMVDEKKITFTPAVELAFITPKNQQYIAVAIEGQQSSPTLSQAQRMRELDQQNLLKPDMIDGIMLEEKKAADKVIISAQELSKYFGKDKTPRDMKDQIIKLLDDWAGKEKELAKPDRKIEQEK